MRIKGLGLFLTFLLVISIIGCGTNPKPTNEELTGINEVFAAQFTAADLKTVTSEFMTKERQGKFQAVKKVFTTPQGDYAFISMPVGYNGPLTLAVGIDKDSGQTVGMRIVKHLETEHYVRDMSNQWFTERFKSKSNDAYLQPVHLEARRDNEIITITGATVTTEAITNGVNACMGVFREAVRGQSAEAVPYMVKFEKAQEEGPQENGALAIRSYGTVLGEVSLEQIKNMPSVKRTMEIRSTSGTTRHSFKGTLLSNVITAVDPSLFERGETVQPVGVDDYMSNILMDEVLKENAVYVMYEDNGEPLLTKDGKPGAMRVVVLDDVFGQRFTNFMIEIVVE